MRGSGRVRLRVGTAERLSRPVVSPAAKPSNRVYGPHAPTTRRSSSNRLRRLVRPFFPFQTIALCIRYGSSLIFLFLQIQKRRRITNREAFRPAAGPYRNLATVKASTATRCNLAPLKQMDQSPFVDLALTLADWVSREEVYRSRCGDRLGATGNSAGR